MATEFVHSALSTSKVAASALTGRRFVKLNASGDVVPFTAATDVPYGLNLFDVPAGGVAHIIKQGVVKIEASGVLAINAVLGGSADGRGASLVLGTDTTKYVAGRVTEAAATAGQIVQVEIDCIAPRTA